MKCPQCGKYVPELDAHCPKCGAQVWGIGEMPEETVSAGRAADDTADENAPESAPEDAEKVPFPAEVGREDAETPPLRWYKFLVFFALFALSAFYIYKAVMVLSGRIYYDAHTAEVIYTYYPLLETLNLLFCAVYVIMAGLCVVTRQKLAHLRKSAPVLSTVLFALCAVMPLLAARLSVNATGIYAFRFTDGAAFIAWGLTAWFNYRYFQNRRGMFTE